MDPISALAAAAAAAGGIKSLFTKQPKATPQYNYSAYQSAPQWQRNIYENIYGPGITQFANQTRNQPLHQYEEQAYNQFGQGINDINANLGQYMHPLNQYLTNKINRRYDESANNIQGLVNDTRGGRVPNPFSSGAVLRQHLNEEGRKRALEENDFMNYERALNLRHQTLGEMISAGSGIRNAPIQNLRSIGALLGLVPNSQSGTGQFTPGYQSNEFEQTAGALNNIAQLNNNGQFKYFWNDTSLPQGMQGPQQQPGLFNTLFQR